MRSEIDVVKAHGLNKFGEPAFVRNRHFGEGPRQLQQLRKDVLRKYFLQGLLEVVGLARGGDFRQSLWQFRQLL